MKKLSKIGMNILILLILLILISTKVFAINQIDISGNVRVGYFNPVEVILETGNFNVDGNIKVDTGFRRFYQPVVLNKNTRKSYSFSIPISSSCSNVKVSIEQKDDVIKK